MKKKVISALFVCLMIGINANAKVKWKTTGGIGLAFQKERKGEMSYTPVFAPHISSGIVVPLSKKVNFETGLMYNIKGFNNKKDMHDGASLVQYRAQSRFHYLSVPLLLNYNFLSKNNYKFWVGTGMNYGFFLGGSEAISVSGYRDNELISFSSWKLPILGRFSDSRYVDAPSSKNIQAIDVMLRLQVNCVWKNRYIIGIFHDHGLQDIDSRKLSDANSVVKLRYTGLTFGIIWN